MNMDSLSEELEKIKISNFSSSLIRNFIYLIENTYVPQFSHGEHHPCDEHDYEDFRKIIDTNLEQIKYNFYDVLKSIKDDCDKQLPILIHLIIIVGEQSEQSHWNTQKSVSLAHNILEEICNFLNIERISQFFTNNLNDNLKKVLITLRPKLLKNTWKNYPAAVLCYKWILHQTQAPKLLEYLSDVLPTALIIYDDYVPANRILGLKCIHKILEHSSMQHEFVRSGYVDVLYDALEKLTRHRETEYIIPLYSCLTTVLMNLEYGNTSNTYEWTKRDNIIGTLLDNMEFETNLELRHAYMTSLPQLLTNIGCAKWCERLTRLLSEYCGNHTDLRTLRATLQVAETILSMFHVRIPSHCLELYSAFLKLHYDLTETPIFDEEIIRSLERCIYLLYNITPAIGSKVIRDDRMRSIIKNNLHFSCFTDTKYCN
ncbi:TELO2-interacting protein 2-like [Chelonus insularis]|uniref:TELO2-interacting protein 2-like n=1 Tax=Chelonus insularis TaxID=460826 RepID=UPI00158B2DD7|nr:TELO2-interacting protein 2-like [Chelonus insularis]XP_034936053.1 TELO2-interacting protein 2-like [Chelonus insularis]